MTNLKELAEAIVKEMKENHHAFWIDPEEHSNQHEFIQLLITERKEKQAKAERIKEKIAGSLILTFILAIVSLIGAGSLDWVRQHLK